MTRRQFAFWVGMGLFWLSRKANAYFADVAAARIMGWSEAQDAARSQRERWKPDENRSWRWFERRSLIGGKWAVTGITVPVNKGTGKPLHNKAGYLDESLVPDAIRKSTAALRSKFALAKPDETRRAEGGRPPSEWLRSLHAHEIRIWLKTIKVPKVGVGGMTFWTHLTRDHSFSAERIEGLTVDEQAKLHSAAHFGY